MGRHSIECHLIILGANNRLPHDPEQRIAVVDLFAHHAIFEPFGV